MKRTEATKPRDGTAGVRGPGSPLGGLYPSRRTLREVEGEHPVGQRGIIALTPGVTGPANLAQGMAQRQDKQSVSLHEVSQTAGNPRISRRISEWVAPPEYRPSSYVPFRLGLRATGWFNRAIRT